MPTTGPDALESRLRHLDERALRAFVADLWAARGHETHREGDLVVAHDGSEETRIRVVAGVRAWPAFALGRREDDDRGVDVVVAPRGGREGSRRVLVAADLAEMVRYALDGPTAARLCERHFGAPLADLRLPRRVRVAGTVASVATSPATPAAVLVVALVAVAALGAAGVVDVPGVRSDAGDEGDFPAVSENGVATGPVKEAAVAAVPGLGPAGVTNATALAAAHRDAVANRSYSQSLTLRDPHQGDGPAAPLTRHTTVWKSDDRRYLHRTTYAYGDDYRRSVTVYHDGRGYAVADFGGEGSPYAYEPTPPANASLFHSPGQRTATVLATYLTAPDSAVTGQVTRDGVTLYRVDLSGTPTATNLTDARGFTATAFVDADGFVREFRANYTVRVDGESHPASLVWEYTRVDRTVVVEPLWYESRWENASTRAEES